jgi:hypothetical protein
MIAATASFAILRTAWAIGGPRMMTTTIGRSFWRIYEWGIFPGNIVVGSVAALAVIVLLHPNHRQRWPIGLLVLVGSPLVFLLCYVVWERVWQTVF